MVFYQTVTCPKGADEMAKSVDPGAVWSGSTLFCLDLSVWVLRIIMAFLLIHLKALDIQLSTSIPSKILNWIIRLIFEPQHDKTNKIAVRPTKTQISLGMRPVWSVFAVHFMSS